MNWIEIDRYLYKLLSEYTDIETVYSTAMKRFSWSRRQAEVAINPLAARLRVLQIQHTTETKVKKTRKKRSRP